MVHTRGTLKTRDWKRRDWKTWDQIARVEKAGLLRNRDQDSSRRRFGWWYWRLHKRRRRDRHHSSHWQQRLRGLPRRTPRSAYRASAMWPKAVLWTVRKRSGTSGSSLSHLPHRHSDDPAYFLTFTLRCVLWSVTFCIERLGHFRICFVVRVTINFVYVGNNLVWNRIHCVCNFHRMVCFLLTFDALWFCVGFFTRSVSVTCTFFCINLLQHIK